MDGDYETDGKDEVDAKETGGGGRGGMDGEDMDSRRKGMVKGRRLVRRWKARGGGWCGAGVGGEEMDNEGQTDSEEVDGVGRAWVVRRWLVRGRRTERG